MKNELVVEGKECEIRKGIVRILALRDELIDELRDPESAIQEILQRQISSDLFTFVQRPTEASRKFSYHSELDNFALLRISTYENWISEQVHPNTRTNILKAKKKGVVVGVESYGDALAVGLVELFNETPIRRGRRFPYYGWNTEMVNRVWGSRLDQSLWLVARYNGELIGFIKLIVSKGLAKTSGTIAKQIYRDKATMNALFAKCVELCTSMGIPLLVYGKFTYGTKGQDSLTEFKMHNGFERVEVPRYYVSLSMRGQIGLQLGLHRRLHEVIPGPILRLLLMLRAKWYEGWEKLYG